MRESAGASSTIARTASSDSSRSLWKAPSTARSAGMTCESIHSPLTWRYRSSAGEGAVVGLVAFAFSSVMRPSVGTGPDRVFDNGVAGKFRI